MSVRLRLLEQSWNLCNFIDYQLVIGVEKMYYKRYFKDKIKAMSYEYKLKNDRNKRYKILNK